MLPGNKGEYADKASPRHPSPCASSNTPALPVVTGNAAIAYNSERYFPVFPDKKVRLSTRDSDRARAVYAVESVPTGHSAPFTPPSSQSDKTRINNIVGLPPRPPATLNRQRASINAGQWSRGYPDSPDSFGTDSSYTPCTPTSTGTLDTPQTPVSPYPYSQIPPYSLLSPLTPPYSPSPSAQPVAVFPFREPVLLAVQNNMFHTPSPKPPRTTSYPSPESVYSTHEEKRAHRREHTTCVSPGR
ncbi:hypothetical protein FISHEDRAFT_76400 [Fistulina hepatica ATCC 64428]|uniref:Uncharacterized protein n=1 Tax=Fistulina hepatica ATCC 64428 TaxID=1128425 RepID=A0A0D7A586_9AGAR|nr:hypothetical protein FISHEDRAFT_76400 [Fistulina hepatica ATCC 64428]